jgi:RNA polymerase sigma-70 factor, ECF subfamily
VKYSALEDEALIQLVAQRQTEALGELYDRYNRLVYSMAFYLLGDEHTAEEVTQDAFTKIWQQADTYRFELAKVKTWLISIARNRAIDELRRRKARPTPIFLEELIYLGDGKLEDLMDNRFDRDRIRVAILDLPFEQRQVLIMAYFNGYSQSEISEVLTLPLGTVKTRIRLAMQKLRREFYEENFIERSK